MQSDELQDLLESLVMYLESHPDPEEWLPYVRRMWPQPIEERRAREILAFVSQPLYKDDGKSFHRRYNLMECKISTADSKRHDRRWESVESWMDGSFTAVMGLTKEFRPSGTLGLWAWLEFVFQETRFGTYECRKWIEIEPEKYDRIRLAFKVCDAYITAADSLRRAREYAAGHADNIRHREARKLAAEHPADTLAAVSE